MVSSSSTGGAPSSSACTSRPAATACGASAWSADVATLSSSTAGQAITLSHAEFEALIEGLDLVVTKRRKRWHPKVSAA